MTLKEMMVIVLTAMVYLGSFLLMVDESLPMGWMFLVEKAAAFGLFYSGMWMTRVCDRKGYYKTIKEFFGV